MAVWRGNDAVDPGHRVVQDGPSELSTACRDRLARFGIPVREERIARLKPQVRATAVFEIAFENGTSLRRRALFFKETGTLSRKHHRPESEPKWTLINPKYRLWKNGDYYD